MNVLMVSTFPPRRCGIGDHAADLATRLARHEGTALRVLTYEDGIERAGEHGDGFEVVRELRRRVTMERFSELFAEYQPDLVHLQSSSFLHHASVSSAVAKTCPVPLVTTVHDAPASRRLFYAIPSLRRLYKMSRRLITHSHVASEILEGFHAVPREKIIQIPLGVDSQEFHPQVNGRRARETYGIGDARIVLFFGFLRPGKGLITLMKAWHQIEHRHPDVLLVLAGGVPGSARRYSLFLRSEAGYPRRLRSLAQRLDLVNRVIFTDHVPEKFLAPLIAAAEVAVLPYTGSPSQSSALFKILSCGKPIVATRVPGFSELLQDGEDALLVPPGNATDLGRAIDGLLTNPEQARRFGERAREKAVTRYDWSLIADETLRVYEEALALDLEWQ